MNLIGGTMPVGGFWAWTTYLFAGTGFAMTIVAAIIGGGVTMLIYKDEIVEWVINQDYKCANCGQVKWSPFDTEESDIEASMTKNQELETIKNAEGALHDKGIDFERLESGWLVLERNGNVKKINSVTELDAYAFFSMNWRGQADLAPKSVEEAQLAIFGRIADSKKQETK